MPPVSSLVANPISYAKAIESLARTGNISESARSLHLPTSTLQRFASNHASAIAERRQALQAETFDELEGTTENGTSRFRVMVGSLVDTAIAGEDRAKAACARVVGELAGMIGPASGVMQGGLTINIDKAAIAVDGSLDPDEMRRRLGLA